MSAQPPAEREGTRNRHLKSAGRPWLLSEDDKRAVEQLLVILRRSIDGSDNETDEG